MNFKQSLKCLATLAIIQSVMSDDLSSIIAHGAKELNIELPPEAEAAFRAYYDFLEKRGRNVNLTAITGAGEVARLHFLDSLALLNAADFKNAKIIDIGSGAGFPGVPLKIAEPSIDLTLLDSTGKRVTFLSELCEKLGIEAGCITARAEEAAHLPAFREQHDIVVSRAVARLNVLCELCVPFVRVGGVFIAMKGVESANEIEEAEGTIEILGAKVQENFDYMVPGTNIKHRAVIVRKVTQTAVKYPRRFAKIQKAPL